MSHYIPLSKQMKKNWVLGCKCTKRSMFINLMLNTQIINHYFLVELIVNSPHLQVKSCPPPSHTHNVFSCACLSFTIYILHFQCKHNIICISVNKRLSIKVTFYIYQKQLGINTLPPVVSYENKHTWIQKNINKCSKLYVCLTMNVRNVWHTCLNPK